MSRTGHSILSTISTSLLELPVNVRNQIGPIIYCGGAVGWSTARVRFPLGLLEIFTDIIFPAAQWPWGRLSLWQKRVPALSPGGKGGQWIGLIALPPWCNECLEIMGSSTSCSRKCLPRPVRG